MAAVMLLASAKAQTPAAQAPQEHDPWATVWANEPAKPLPPGVTHHTYWSAAMGRPVGYCIYLPPSYDADTSRRFPVIYELHGNGGTELSAVKISGALQASMNAGKIGPCLMVFPNGGLSTMYTDSVDGKVMAQTTIIKELIPYIDSHYRTIPRREARGVEGFSMGGHGAAVLAFKYPELFGSFIGWAGGMQTIAARYAIREKVPAAHRYLGDDEKYYQANDPFFLLRANADRIRGHMVIQLVCGTGDGFHLAGTRKLHTLLDSLKIAHSYTEVPGVKHVLAPLRAPFGTGDFDTHAREFQRVAAAGSAH